MWDERYSDERYVYGRDPNDFLRANWRQLPPGKVLCLAEGEGRNAVFLALQGYTVTAVDSSAVGLAKGARLARECGTSVEWVCADLTGYALGQAQWDGVVSIFCHLPAALRSDLHRRVVNGLKPGGVLLLEAYTPGQLGRGTGGPPTAALMMEAATLRQELGELQIEQLRECEREIREGTLHNGLGAVVQLLARRRV